VINCRAFTAGISPTSRLQNPFITTLTASHQCYHKFSPRGTLLCFLPSACPGAEDALVTPLRPRDYGGTGRSAGIGAISMLLTVGLAPSELGARVRGTGVRGKRPKAAKCRQIAGGPALRLFLLVTASCTPFHQAVSSASPQRGPVPII
jgi:hypothetical protein